MTCQTDTRAFDRMLRENGFSRSRAKAITAKGFKATDMGMDEAHEVADLIDSLKTSQLRLEEKGFTEKFDLWAPPYFWSPGWKPLKTVSSHPTVRSSFSLKFESFSDAPGPFEVQVKYVAPSGDKTVTLYSPSQEKFEIIKNSWQVPKLRARSKSGTGQMIRVIKWGS